MKTDDGKIRYQFLQYTKYKVLELAYKILQKNPTLGHIYGKGGTYLSAMSARDMTRKQ